VQGINPRHTAESRRRLIRGVAYAHKDAWRPLHPLFQPLSCWPPKRPALLFCRADVLSPRRTGAPARSGFRSPSPRRSPTSPTQPGCSTNGSRSFGCPTARWRPPETSAFIAVSRSAWAAWRVTRSSASITACATTVSADLPASPRLRSRLRSASSPRRLPAAAWPGLPQLSGTAQYQETRHPLPCGRG